MAKLELFIQALWVKVAAWARLHRDRRGALAGAVSMAWGAALTLGGCSEAMNWRVLPLGDSGWAAMMPCKPDAAQREISWPAGAATLEMRSCDAAGATYAVAWMHMGDAAQAAATLALWRQASQRSAQASGALLDPPWSVRGADVAQRWQGQGARGDGHALAVSFGHVAMGPWLVQLARYGRQAPSTEVDAFWDGLTLQRR